MQYFTTPSGTKILYDNMHAYTETPNHHRTHLFKATPALIDTLISRGSLSPVCPVLSYASR